MSLRRQRTSIAWVTLLVYFSGFFCGTGEGKGSELDRVEAETVQRYLDRLATGGAADAKLLDHLADVAWPSVEKIIRRYVVLPEPVEVHTHRAFQALLERTTRTALQPWILVETYSSEFADFLQSSQNGHDESSIELADKLFRRLRFSEPDRRTWDLVVRLCPGASLHALSHTSEAANADLFEAWNRRLTRGRISQPIRQLNEKLERIGKAKSARETARSREAKLEFLGRWTTTRDEYEKQLAAGIQHLDRAPVLAALRVQGKIPACLELNIGLIEQHKTDDELIALALQSFAADSSGEHAPLLRQLWPALPPTPSKARYHALLAMSVHPKGNQDIAVEALRQQPFEYMDAALGILRIGDIAAARAAVEFLITKSERGHEEALRLATERKLSGFEDAAVQLALSPQREPIARQAALRYLQSANGTHRQKIVKLLTEKNADVRLAAIQCLGPQDGLTAADKDELGPTLIQVADEDRSEGHRQEAMFALGLWADAQAAPFFQNLLKQNPSIILADEPFNHEQYWRYRFRLMGLVGLARLNDPAAFEELGKLHQKGGPTEKMDVLLAWLSVRKCPEYVLQNLESDEPKLIATAVRLVLDHGSQTQQAVLRAYFARSKIWQQFRDSGIDDHNLLRMLEEKSLP